MYLSEQPIIAHDPIEHWTIDKNFHLKDIEFVYYTFDEASFIV